MMDPTIRIGCKVAASALGLALLLGASARGEELLKSCRLPALRNEVLCGSIARPLDAARPEGKKIDIHFVVMPAAARRKLPDPVFILAGGPGQSAIGAAAAMLPLVDRLNNRRDIVFVDQRGTGRSAPLECEDQRRRPLAEQADLQRQVAAFRACRERLATLPHGDLRQYTTAIAMQDLDAVRRHLGADRVNLVAGSYGTRGAIDYLRQFPQAVRRVVADGVVPPDMVLPASLSTDGQTALDAMFDACEQQPECLRAYPRLRADWAGLLGRLPTSATVAHPLNGRPERMEVTRDLVLDSVRGALYIPWLASSLPQAITDAAQGNYAALAGMNYIYRPGKGMELAMGMHFSIICSEDATRPPRAGDEPGRDFGRDIEERYRRICADWPRGDVPPAFYELPAARSPILLVSGGLDPATPPRHGDRVLKALGANARHLVVPNAGHGVLEIGCMPSVLFRFIDAESDRDALGVDADCVVRIPRPPAFRAPVLGSVP